ncbi:OLC1v1028957C1 [Oldenlandia corymbosa var. corymbosa]|uniref:OLC1v1028957C1 n=1 Tax=Oldenlandia corymbosa var. corymbosa TaxID=529605 RepID=A0AAV1CDB2_OLDCO|nr:OLC1v1028957C1 [Oldenlandia corymbosa var. corymbosa]
MDFNIGGCPLPLVAPGLREILKELGVSRSTLKRRCRDLGIKRWAWHKRNKVVRPNRSLEVGGEVVQDSETGHPNDATSQPYTFIVRATYGDDTVKFQLCSNSRFEDLVMELHERFKLEVGRFKIKYEDNDGDWILIDNLKSVGQTVTT